MTSSLLGFGFRIAPSAGASPVMRTTWDTTKAGSGNRTITLPMPAGPLVDWLDGTVNNLNTHTYAVGGIKKVNIEGLVTGWRFADSGDRLKLLSVESTGSMAIDDAEMFQGCDNMTHFVFNNIVQVTSTSLAWMFDNCGSLLSLDLSMLDTKNVITFRGIFRFCRALFFVDVSSFNTEKAEDLSYMFRECESIASLDVSHFITTICKAMEGMFSSMDSLVSLNITGFDTTNVEYFAWFLHNNLLLTVFDATTISTDSAIDLRSMIEGCRSLLTVDVSGWNTGNCRNFYGLFRWLDNMINPIGFEDIDISSAVVGSALGNGFNSDGVRLMFEGTIVPQLRYEALLVNWSNYSPPIQSGMSTIVGTGTLYQTPESVTARTFLTGDRNLTIIGDSRII